MKKQVKLINLPKIKDPRGNLTFFENLEQISFKIARVFWTYDVPGGEIRGGHAYRQQEELILALSGSFDVILTRPSGKKRVYTLNRSYYGLYLPPMTWRHMENFSTNALSLHLSSHFFDPKDYIRNFDDYRET